MLHDTDRARSADLQQQDSSAADNPGVAVTHNPANVAPEEEAAEPSAEQHRGAVLAVFPEVLALGRMPKVAHHLLTVAFVLNSLFLIVRQRKLRRLLGSVGAALASLRLAVAPAAGLEALGINEMEISDESIKSLKKWRVLLFQGGALFTSLNLQENVAVPLIEHAGLKRPLAEHLAQMKLALAGLPPEAALKYPAELSGGMVKRAALARALALDPEILFLDEPTAGLDPIGAAAFDHLLKTLRDALGLTVFMVTHDLDTLYSTCDRVAVLSQQKVLVAATLAAVETTDDPWVHDYFHGPRGRAAARAATARIQEQ